MISLEHVREAEEEFGVKVPADYNLDFGCGCPECYWKELATFRDYAEDLAMAQEANSK